MILIFGGTVTSFIDFFPSQILICDWSNTGHVIKYWSCDQILACDWWVWIHRIHNSGILVVATP